MSNAESTERERKDAVLSMVKARVEADVYSAIELAIARLEPVYLLSIVAQPRGEPEKTEYALGPYYIDSSDSSIGRVFIPIGQKQYLEISCAP